MESKTKSMTPSQPLHAWHTSMDLLTGCDTEPVQFIGTVQAHGAVLVFDREAPYRLLGASQDWRETVSSVLEEGEELSDIFPPAVVAAILEADDLPRLLSEAESGPELSVHLSGDRILLEAEQVDGAADFDPINCLHSCLSGMSRARCSVGLLKELAAKLQASLGVERVMIYRFLPDWTGEVVAEAATSGQQYLGLRFPSTDIPRPARAIFSKVWVRHIADVEAPSRAIELREGSATSLDLTQIGLRAPAGVHLEYLRNMAVGSSITLSLRVHGKLWGLIACHHDGPHRVRPSHRAALEVLAQVISAHLSEQLDRESRDERTQAEATLDFLRQEMERRNSLELAPLLARLETLVESDLLAIHENSRWNCPEGYSHNALDRSLPWIRSHLSAESSIQHETELPSHLTEAFAGVLAIAPSGPYGPLVCYFRREQAQSVRWAGAPVKVPGPGQSLHPRASFAEYLQVTRGRSLDWTALDLWKAERLVQSYRAAALYLNQRLEVSNQALARSNSELDSFAYMASHDLKEPIRGIANYATFLQEDYGHLIEGEGRNYLQSLSELAGRMTNLVDGLLAYSRLNHQEMELVPCSLDEIAKEAASLVRSTRAVEVLVKHPLPVVLAYPPFLVEILQNLVTNAAKYSRQEQQRVEIGALPEGDHEWTFYVRDNGIGIPREFQDEIFRLFRRLHGEGEYGGGTGLGLTIVKRMVERHGGAVRVESEPGVGTTFYVSLPKVP